MKYRHQRPDGLWQLYGNLSKVPDVQNSGINEVIFLQHPKHLASSAIFLDVKSECPTDSLSNVLGCLVKLINCTSSQYLFDSNLTLYNFIPHRVMLHASKTQQVHCAVTNINISLKLACWESPFNLFPQQQSEVCGWGKVWLHEQSHAWPSVHDAVWDAYKITREAC